MSYFVTVDTEVTIDPAELEGAGWHHEDDCDANAKPKPTGRESCRCEIHRRSILTDDDVAWARSVLPRSVKGGKT